MTASKRINLSVFRHFESRALILVMGAAAGLWAFLNLASEVGEGETLTLDRAILLALRDPSNINNPIGSRGLEESMRDFTALGGVTVVALITIIGTLAFLIHRKRWHAALLSGTVLLADLSSQLLKIAYGRPRPDVAPHGSYVYSASFPSGHSTSAAALFLTLAMLISSLEDRRATKILVYGVALFLVLAIGFSRVYLAVHWPSDVLGGWCLGASWALVAWVVLLRVRGADVALSPADRS